MHVYEYVIMDADEIITLGPDDCKEPTGPWPQGANTDTKLLIYGLFQKGRVLAQDGTAFDDAVEQTLLRLPPQFREFLENVEVGVEDTLSPELIAKGLEFDLLGVYIGQTAGSDDWDFPDRVVLFQRNIENISPDRETLLAEIRDTLLHEVGHHFGMDEDTLREIEDGDEP